VDYIDDDGTAAATREEDIEGLNFMNEEQKNALSSILDKSAQVINEKYFF
jgi:hypothetical protein